MSAIITLSSRIETAKEYISRYFDDINIPSYFYTGRNDRWDDEYSPDVSDSSNAQITDHLMKRIFMKKLVVDDTTLAIRRFTWKQWTTYTRADHNVDYTDYRTWTHPEGPFYVMNSQGNVYKCISNNYGVPSTEEPTGQSLSYIYLGDGYIWKFMFDITTTISDKFLTDTWIPVPHVVGNKSFAHLQVEGAVVDGDIPYIHVNSSGDGYTSTPVIQVRGDGTGCTAIAILEGSILKTIQIVNVGSGYTYADVLIFGNGTGASATAMISPSGGHGFDANMEMGSYFVEMSTEIIGDEGGDAPITGTYRNIGIVNHPKLTDGNNITDSVINTLSDINIINASGTFLNGEKIIGEDSGVQCMLYNDPTGTDKTLVMYMLDGEFTDGEKLHGQITGEVGDYVHTGSVYTTVDIQTGDLLYKENIIFITRRLIQIEKFTFSVEF